MAAKEQRADAPRRGRPRDERSRAAILRAALGLVAQQGWRGFSIDALAARAGVGKQTIYRWWPSRAAIVLEAFRGDAEERVQLPDEGDLASDLRVFLRRTFRALRKTGPVMRTLLAEAQHDDGFRDAFRNDFVRPRRAQLALLFARARTRGEITDEPDLDLLLDLVYGPTWYRLLVGHGALSDAAARALADAVARAAGASRLRRQAPMR